MPSLLLVTAPGRDCETYPLLGLDEILNHVRSLFYSADEEADVQPADDSVV